MTGRLVGKTALVTAAGAGIGRACAEAFAREGATVIAADIDRIALDGLLDVETAYLDVTDAAACQAIPDHWPTIDILLNAVGLVHEGTILDCTPEDWSRSLAVNVTSVFQTVRAVLPGMAARRTGSIINIASVVSSLKGAPNRAAYAATKAAIIGLTKSVAVDFVRTGVRCNAICPGTINSPSLAGRINSTPNPTATRKAFVERQPMQRLGRPEEIAALAVFLASDEASFITGNTEIADGGWLA